MLRTLIVLPPVLAIIFSSSWLLCSASAQEMCWWNKMAADWHRVHCWPKPFDRADRTALQAPFSTMKNNGWRRQTTLGEHHFNWETEELNHAGNGQLRWILTQAPLNRRTVYVQQGKTATSTAARVDSVKSPCWTCCRTDHFRKSSRLSVVPLRCKQSLSISFIAGLTPPSPIRVYPALTPEKDPSPGFPPDLSTSHASDNGAFFSSLNSKCRISALKADLG